MILFHHGCIALVVYKGLFVVMCHWWVTLVVEYTILCGKKTQGGKLRLQGKIREFHLYQSEVTLFATCAWNGQNSVLKNIRDVYINTETNHLFACYAAGAIGSVVIAEPLTHVYQRYGLALFLHRLNDMMPCVLLLSTWDESLFAATVLATTFTKFLDAFRGMSRKI